MATETTKTNTVSVTHQMRKSKGFFPLYARATYQLCNQGTVGGNGNFGENFFKNFISIINTAKIDYTFFL